MSRRTIKIGDIGKVSMCKRVLKHQTSEDGDIPFYKISTFGSKPDAYISKELYLELSKNYSFPSKGDVLISAAGTLGRTVIYDGSPSYFQDSNIVWVENDESKITNSYLYYFYQTKPWLTTDGSTIKRIYNDNLRNIPIRHPDIKTQNEITEVLSSLDSKINVNNKINTNLEDISKLIYDYWFVQFNFPDKNGKPYKTSGGNMVWSDKLNRDIPEGWGVKSLIEFSNNYDSDRIPLSSKQREKIQGKYPYYGATGVMDHIDKYIFDGEYILVAEDGSVEDDKGYVIIQYIWGKTWVNNHAHVIQAKDTKNNDYLYWSLKLIPAIQITTGSVQKKINQENLNNVKIIDPGEKLLTSFSNLMIPIRRKLIVSKEENAQLESLRDWLLPMLMNGQVTVKSNKEVQEIISTDPNNLSKPEGIGSLV